MIQIIKKIILKLFKKNEIDKKVFCPYYMEEDYLCKNGKRLFKKLVYSQGGVFTENIFSMDGFLMFYTKKNNNFVIYLLSEPWNISTAKYLGEFKDLKNEN